MKTQTEQEIKEGGKCPCCDGGILFFPPPENCSCHISAPCGSCTGVQLTCKKCGWEDDPPVNEEKYRHVGGGIVANYYTRPSHEFGEGKRIFDWDYDSSSGSTMDYKGRYKGDVTAQDIINYFGDGSFGHRGPTLRDGVFTYTKITD